MLKPIIIFILRLYYNIIILMKKKFFMLRIWLSIFNYCHHKTIMNDSSVIRDPKESLYGIKIQSKSGHECISLNDHFILIFIDLCPQMIIIGF